MNQRRTRLSVPDQIALLRSWGVDVEERGAENDSRGQARIADVRWFSDPDRFEVTTYSGAEGLAETLEKIATMVTDPRGSRWFIERDEGGETCGGCSWVR
ncbi:MAG: hypothetical protein KQH57_17260 [Actinomycetales bacterium]|nr:hypothetical protein [Actinomycetales bacterium]